MNYKKSAILLLTPLSLSFAVMAYLVMLLAFVYPSVALHASFFSFAFALVAILLAYFLFVIVRSMRLVELGLLLASIALSGFMVMYFENDAFRDLFYGACGWIARLMLTVVHQG